MHIFSDETNYDGFRLIGTLWLPKSSFLKFESEIIELRNKYGFWEEVKFSNISERSIQERFDFYEAFLNIALKLDRLKIAAIRYSTDIRLCRKYYSGGPAQRDLSFLRLVVAKRAPYFFEIGDAGFRILRDRYEKSNQERPHDIGDTFSRYLTKQTGHAVLWSRPADSKICATLQLADLITGLISYRLQNQKDEDIQSKRGRLAHLIEIKFNRKLFTPSLLTETPYNLFLHSGSVEKLLK